MSCTLKIKSCTSYTLTEKKITDYILAHKDQIIYDTTQVLAEKIRVSPAAIVRLSQKLGYQGFPELKLDLAMEQDSEEEDMFSEQIKNHDPLETIIKKRQSSDLSMIKMTYEMISPQAIQEAVDKLKRAQRIYLFGISASAICCMDLAQKLTRIGYDVVCFQDYHTQLAASANITSRDVALAISSRGKTREVVAALRHAREKKAMTIALTQFSRSPIQKYADTLILFPHQENELRLGAFSSRNATLICTDLIYLGMIREDLNQTIEKLKYSRAVVKGMLD